MRKNAAVCNLLLGIFSIFGCISVVQICQEGVDVLKQTSHIQRWVQRSLTEILAIKSSFVCFKMLTFSGET
jgi:hypothetical protein